MSGPFKYCSQMEDVGLLDFLAPAVDSRITFTRASTRTYFDRNGVMQTAAVNEWPLEYDPATLQLLGRARWAQRTNIFIRSQEFDNAAWSKSNLTITANAITAPDGTMTADKVEATATGLATGRYIGGGTATNVAEVFSIFTKKGSLSTVTFTARNDTTGVNFTDGTLNYDTGQITGTNWRVMPCANGWFRVIFFQLTGITVGDTLSFYYGARSTSLTAGDYWYVWGAQCEGAGSTQNPHATPYIATTTASVTRSEDIATVSTLSSLGWNANAGTIMVDAIVRYEDDALGNIYFGAFHESNVEYWAWLLNCATSRTGQITSSLRGNTFETATGDATDFAPSLAVHVVFASAFSVADNVVRLSVSGELETGDTTPSAMPTPTEFRIGRGPAVSDLGFGGWLRRIRYYPYRVSDAILVKLGK